MVRVLGRVICIVIDRIRVIVLVLDMRCPAN